MPKTLIFGATGHIGRQVAAIVHRTEGEDLRVTSSRESGLRRLRERFPHAETVICDWYDEDSVAAALRDVDKVFVVTPDLVTDEAVVTPNIIRAASRAGGVELIVRLVAMPPGYTLDDVSQEYLDTRCGAGLHLVAKPLLEASGLPVTYVNVPAWIMFDLGLFLAADVKPRRRIAMPASSDSSRMWISEGDIGAVIARILTDPVADHVGKEYILTSAERLSYADIAAIFTDMLGEPVTYADDDGPMRDALGQYADAVMTYYRCEHGTYAGVVHNETITQLLGRPAETMRDYVAARIEDYA
jgi:uncharacterized protein YbjT (DUF2867 family)